MVVVVEIVVVVVVVLAKVVLVEEVMVVVSWEISPLTNFSTSLSAHSASYLLFTWLLR